MFAKNKVTAFSIIMIVVISAIPIASDVFADLGTDSSAKADFSELNWSGYNIITNNITEGDDVKTTQQSDISSVSAGDILLADEIWNASDEKSIVLLKSASDKGAILITSKGASLFTENKTFGSVAYSPDSALCGYYRDEINNLTYCYSVDCTNASDGLERISQWASDVDDLEPSDSILYIDGVVCQKDVQCGSNGWMSINTVYYFEGSDYDSYDYWVVGYYMESVPNSGSYTKMMKVYDDFNENTFLDGQLLKHSPNTTVGSSTASVSVSMSISGPSVSVGWSYDTPDVTVQNNSSLASEVYSVTHNISRGSAASTNTYSCEPGAIIKCDSGDVDYAYCPTDTYTVEYSYYVDRILFGYWQSNTYSTTIQPMLYPDR